MTSKRRVTMALVAASVLTACHGSTGEQASTLSDSVVIPGERGAAVLGTGYDRHSESFTEPCAKSAEPNQKVIYSGTPRAELRLDRSLTYDELKGLISTDVAGKLSLKAVQAKGAVSFLTEAASTDLSTALTFSYQMRGLYALMNRPTLTDGAIEVANTHNSAEIRTRCGDSFIDQVELGSQLFVTMRFDFANTDVKSKFEAEIDLDFVNLFQISGKSKIALEKYNKDVGVTISAFQVGGDLSKLTRIFATHGTSESPVLRCSIDDVDACVKAMEAVVKYASGSDEGDYPSQIANMDYTTNNPKGLAFLNYKAKGYYEAGLRQLYQTPGPVLKAEIGQARERLMTIYETQSRDRARALSLKGLRMAPEQKQKINDLYDKVSRNVTKIVETAQICYDRPGECITAEKNMKLENYDSNDLVKVFLFFDYCVSEGRDTPARATINAIRSYFQMPERTECEDIEANLNDSTILDLSNKEISDLKPLRGLNKLRVLNLQNNRISNLSPLQNLKSLETLNIRGNIVSNLEPVSTLPKLHTLDAAYNRITSLEPLREMKTLRKLRVQENLFGEDFEPVEGLQLTERYLSTSQICETELHWALDSGEISERQYNLYRRQNFAPAYNVDGDRSSGIASFIYCPAAASVF